MDILEKMELEEMLKDKESLSLNARALKAIFDSYVEAGFEKYEAMELVIAVLNND